jgi:hypothetical protein
MPLVSRLLVSLSLVAVAACSTSRTQEELVGTAVEELSAIPPLPTSGTAQYKFIYISSTGIADPPWDSAVSITGTGATRTLAYNVLGSAVQRQVKSDGRQPDTDTEQQANVRMFGTLPPSGTPPQLGAQWTIPLPPALQQRLINQTATGVSSTRPVFSGTFAGFLDLASPAGFTIVRAVVRSQQWAARPAGIGGANGIQPGLTAIGVVDLAVGTGAFTGIIPLRAAYFADPAAKLPDSANWQAVAAGSHTTDLYCLTAEPGIPAALIASIPTIPGAPFPVAFTQCTH